MILKRNTGINKYTDKLKINAKILRYMFTLSSTPKNPIQYNADESYVALGFPVAVETILGQAMKLSTDGTVTAVTAVSDIIVGTVTKGCKTADVTKRVTLITQFRAVIVGQASGTVAVGGIVDAEAFDGTTKKQKYKATTGGGNKIGQALTGGVDGAEIQVGIY